MLHISLSMTIDAPRHPHRGNTGYAVHRLHRTVTFLTGQSRLDMALVCKVHVVRNVVNLDPRYRFLVFPVGGQLQNFRAFADTGYRAVTAHTFADAGYAGNRRLVGVNVAVLARNCIVRGMYRVTEFDGLNRAAIGEILAVYPCAYKKPEHEHQPKQSWFFCRL